MLLSLHIENVAVIERADIAFDTGFNVLTGETGAGKSIIIDSLGAVLGERVSRDLVRTGSEMANISALFGQLSEEVVKTLDELGYQPDEDGLLLINRQISADGKSSARINGRPATAAILRQIGRLLVNMHGQHENQALLSPEKHVEYLDRFGGLLPLRAEYAALYKEYRHIQQQLSRLDMDENAKARQMDLLRYQIQEIESAQLVPGEEEELKAKREFFRNAEKIARSVMGAYAALTGDEDQSGALDGVSEAVSLMQDAGQYVVQAAELGDKMADLLYQLEDCATELRGFLDQLDFDQQEWDLVEDRLDLIRRLTMKYGADTSEVLAYLEKCRAELAAIETSEEEMARLTEQLRTAEKAATQAAARLTAARKKAAESFTRQVMEHLDFLNMPGVRMEVSIQPAPMDETGADKVEFLISANRGEPVKPIAKIASGGELSRIMLAIQSVLADVDDIDTLVFDEIDTGISGQAAVKVGIKLHQTATGSSGKCRRQVLCVTHLAQIAAQAHHHLLISKSVRDNRTFTEVTVLDETGREQELARIISGSVTQAGLQAAREMRKARLSS